MIMTRARRGSARIRSDGCMATSHGSAHEQPRRGPPRPIQRRRPYHPILGGAGLILAGAHSASDLAKWTREWSAAGFDGAARRRCLLDR
ncbi:hypothetical protein RW1_005_01090 [Rhodococcus wratislaviensis NBRC 100605]|uniref:Uncharacterized protein n=1 Tax=Rhodococcus wratislaviensis NBRC 100605 TaxID=1219028 RepID=X0PZ39_RHOWR|nr:hypothetical protein RW1_005_01090 [Rhodococcus wratislaviensis NBRC 100605]